MATLTNFIYCLNAERVSSGDGNGEGINAMGIMSTLMPEFVPGTFSFSVILSILDIDVMEGCNKLQIMFKDEEGNAIVDTGELSLPVLPEDEEPQIPKEYKGLNLSMDFRNVIFEKNGVYNTEIYLNGELLSANPIYVKGKRSV